MVSCELSSNLLPFLLCKRGLSSFVFRDRDSEDSDEQRFRRAMKKQVYLT